MKSFFFFLLGFYSLVNASTSSYQIENIAFPDDMPPEIGGLAFDKKGNLYACLRRGDVLVTKPEKDPSSTEWKVFATGLHNPMGMELIGPGPHCCYPNGRVYRNYRYRSGWSGRSL